MNKPCKWFLLAGALPLLMLFALSQGPVDIGLLDIGQCLVSGCADVRLGVIVHEIRIPRVATALVAGAGLAWAGAILQTCTRNALADPYLFGVVAGAGLGVTLASMAIPHLPNWGLPVFAFLGAIAAIFIVVSIIHLLLRPDMLILVGVAMAFMLAAVTHFLLYLSEPMASNRVMFWLMGSLANTNQSQVMVMFLVVLAGIGFSLLWQRPLATLLLDDDSASSLGVDVAKTRLILLLACALVTSVIVAYCGGIGFVGLMIPHIVRLVFGNDMRSVLIGSTVLGATFLVAVDAMARWLVPAQELPIGIVTAIFGSMFFIFLIAKAKSHV